MHPCHRCNRHIKAEPHCPFCGAPVASRPRHSMLLVATGFAFQSAPQAPCDPSDDLCKIQVLKEAYAEKQKPEILLQIATRSAEIGDDRQAATYYTLFQRKCRAQSGEACVDVSGSLARA